MSDEKPPSKPNPGSRTRDGITPKQKAFARFYGGKAKGNGVLACRMAGYEGTDASLASIASENLRKVEVVAILAELESKAVAKSVATTKELREILTSLARDDESASEHELEYDAAGRPLVDPRKLTVEMKEYMRTHHGALPVDCGDVFFRRRTKKGERISAANTLLKMSGALIDNVQLKVEGGLKTLIPMLQQHMRPESFADLVDALGKVSAERGES